MDSRCAPGRILGDHFEDQITDLFRDPLPSHQATGAGDRSPIQRESGSVPTDHGLRTDHEEGLLPAIPKPARKNPEELLQQSSSRSGVFALEDSELLAEDEVFEQQIPASTKTTKKGSQKQSDRL